MTTSNPFVNERRAARLLGLPPAWLRLKAEAGQLPHLKVNRRRYYDIDAVRAALATMTVGTVANRRDGSQRYAVRG